MHSFTDSIDVPEQPRLSRADAIAQMDALRDALSRIRAWTDTVVDNRTANDAIGAIRCISRNFS